MFNLNDWIYVYKRAAAQFADRMSYVATGAGLSLVLMLANLFLAPLLFVGGGMFAGILFSLWQAVLLSIFYYLILSVIRRPRLGFHSFKDGMSAFFYKVLGIRFLLWFLYAFAGNVLMYRFSFAGIPVIPLLLYLALSPLPETIYQRHDHFIDAFKRVIIFQRENFVIWGVLIVIWQVLVYGLTGSMDTGLLTFSPNIFAMGGISGIAGSIIGQLIFFAWMVYRGLVYQLLDKSSRRKRAFERRMM